MHDMTLSTAENIFEIQGVKIALTNFIFYNNLHFMQYL